FGTGGHICGRGSRDSGALRRERKCGCAFRGADDERSCELAHARLFSPPVARESIRGAAVGDPTRWISERGKEKTRRISGDQRRDPRAGRTVVQSTRVLIVSGGRAWNRAQRQRRLGSEPAQRRRNRGTNKPAGCGS